MNAKTQKSMQYAVEFETIAPSLAGAQLGWLRVIREKAMQRFSESGFPSPREEEWRYTNVAPIERKLFSPADRSPDAFEKSHLEKYLLDDVDSVVLIDGHFSDQFSDISRLPDGVIVSSMGNALEKWPELVRAAFGQSIKQESQGFIAFNTAFFSDGLFVNLEPDIVLERPVQLLNYSTRQDTLVTSRNLVIAGQGAQGQIVETFAGAVDKGYLNASVTEVIVEANAHLEMIKLQMESPKAFHFGGVYAKQADYSIFRHHGYGFGGVLVRNEIHCGLGDASECYLNGLYLAGKRQHMDNHTHIDHFKAHGISRETYKGILDDRARGVFRGRVVVHADAQKTDSEMSNRNLLLSDNAEADTKPQLEIYADDVKCAHGVTVGQLENESVFYLRSRGVDETTARSMLTFAFANEMVDKLQNQEIRNMLLEALLERFPQSDVRKEWL